MNIEQLLVKWKLDGRFVDRHVLHGAGNSEVVHLTVYPKIRIAGYDRPEAYVIYRHINGGKMKFIHADLFHSDGTVFIQNAKMNDLDTFVR